MTSPFLEPSAADGGNLVGADPRNIPTAELRKLGGPTSPIRAIRTRCIDCSGGSVAEARKCTAIGCALWAFRMGSNVFHGAREAENPAANLGAFSEAAT